MFTTLRSALDARAERHGNVYLLQKGHDKALRREHAEKIVDYIRSLDALPTFIGGDFNGLLPSRGSSLEDPNDWVVAELLEMGYVRLPKKTLPTFYSIAKEDARDQRHVDWRAATNDMLTLTTVQGLSPKVPKSRIGELAGRLALVPCRVIQPRYPNAHDTIVIELGAPADVGEDDDDEVETARGDTLIMYEPFMMSAPANAVLNDMVEAIRWNQLFPTEPGLMKRTIVARSSYNPFKKHAIAPRNSEDEELEGDADAEWKEEAGGAGEPTDYAISIAAGRRPRPRSTTSSRTRRLSARPCTRRSAEG